MTAIAPLTNHDTVWRQPWMSKLSYLLAFNRKSAAMRLLNKVIEKDMPLFRHADDLAYREGRRLAWLYRIDLLLEWGREPEALAWACLECEMYPESVAAQALKQQLKRALHLLPVDKSGKPAAGRSSGSKLRLTWDNVAGMREIKAMLEHGVILPLREPELYARYKVGLPNGVLFYGPPGCGKTYIARKLAEFMNFHFIEVKPSELGSIYVHGGQLKIGELFKEAKEMAPTLMFFDEFDALVPNRDGGKLYHSYAAEVNEFLMHLNECAKEGILVIAATNLLNSIDPAVQRPGRMDKKIFIGPPDLEARLEMFKLFMKDRPQELLNWVQLAEATDLYTPAELEALVNEAARIALDAHRTICMSDFTHARRTIRPALTQKQMDALRAEENKS